MSVPTPDSPARVPRRVLLIGATGTIGRATARALVARGHEVVCFVRPRSTPPGGAGTSATRFRALPWSATATSPTRSRSRAMAFAASASMQWCRASRHGPARRAMPGRSIMMPMSACWTPPRPRASAYGAAVGDLRPEAAAVFQHAKLAFERALIESGIAYSIVRPTAFFKSLSGQVDRVKRGKPWLLFGDGALTACKPISDDDLGRYLVECVEDEGRRNRVLPIGGPGPAITPRQQGEALYALLGQSPRFKQVPVALMDGIIGVLATLGRVIPRVTDKAELARIGRYYATESMLVLDDATGRYDADATPSTGTRPCSTTMRGWSAAMRRRNAATTQCSEHCSTRTESATAGAVGGTFSAAIRWGCGCCSPIRGACPGLEMILIPMVSEAAALAAQAPKIEEHYFEIMFGLGAMILLVAWMPIALKRLPLSLPIVCVAIGVALFSIRPSRAGRRIPTRRRHWWSAPPS
jgi:divinyl chlorophyllide a 8-vinyl-reductase